MSIFGDGTNKQRESLLGNELLGSNSNSLIDSNKKVVQKSLAEVISIEASGNKGSSPFYKIRILEEGKTVNAILSGRPESWNEKTLPKSNDYVYIEYKADYYYPIIVEVTDRFLDPELTMKDSWEKTKWNSLNAVNTFLDGLRAIWHGITGNTQWVESGPTATKEKAQASMLSTKGMTDTPLTDKFFGYPDDKGASTRRSSPSGVK